VDRLLRAPLANLRFLACATFPQLAEALDLLANGEMLRAPRLKLRLQRLATLAQAALISPQQLRTLGPRREIAAHVIAGYGIRKAGPLRAQASHVAVELRGAALHLQATSACVLFEALLPFEHLSEAKHSPSSPSSPAWRARSAARESPSSSCAPRDPGGGTI